MDRLSIITIVCSLPLLVWVQGCQGQEPPSPPRSRVVSVAAKEQSPISLKDYCDVSHTAGQEKKLALPALDKSPELSGDRARWINVWATWCKPCIEEMPMLERWAKQMNGEGLGVDLLFVSADETAELMAQFLAEHKDISTSLRLTDPDSLKPWMIELGLDEAAGLPIHIFADKKGLIRCVRAAAIGRGDYATVTRLLSVHQ